MACQFCNDTGWYTDPHREVGLSKESEPCPKGCRATIEAKTIETKALVALENAADLPKGKSLVLHGQNRDLFVLRRNAPYDQFFLRLENPQDKMHSRFCDNKGQLLEDLQYFYATDALPFSKVDWH